MYYADNHVAGMLWNMKEHSVRNGVTVYLIPGAIPFHFTKIIGEWVPRGNDNYFMIHSWDNKHKDYHCR